MDSKEALDAMRIAAQVLLDQAGEDYAAKFSAVSESIYMHRRYTSLSDLARPVEKQGKPEGPIRVLDNHEVRGEGATADEAMKDWQAKLNEKPQAGQRLVWRVKPEIDWIKDFHQQRVRWGVYARFAVLP